MTGLIVVEPGLSTTVQDMGRPGHREWGVPVSGAFDRGAAELANALLGNPPSSAVLELTLLGGVYRAACHLSLAMAGAPMEAKVVGPDSIEKALRLPLSWTLREGERLVLGRTLEGARTYLAVGGGWQTKVHLGSRSSERRIQPGEILPAGPGTTATRHPSEPTWSSPAAEAFHIIDGPDVRPDSRRIDRSWQRRAFRVGSRSDRMGLRLEGDPVTMSAAAERLSSPVAPGAIQLAGGQLIVLGVACGTMGGYLHIAHVISADLDRLGQLRPGDELTFRLVTLDEARRRDRSHARSRRDRSNQLAAMARDR